MEHTRILKKRGEKSMDFEFEAFKTLIISLTRVFLNSKFLIRKLKPNR